MICFLWILFPSLASMVQAGGSGSGEVVKGGGGGGMMNGGMGGNGGNTGMLNGIILNGQLPQLVPVGALLIPQQPQQQPAGPVNQGPMGGLQGPGIPLQGPGIPLQGPGFPLQGPGILPGATLPLAFALPQQQQQPTLPQGQPQLPQTALPLFAVVPQANGMGMGMGGVQFPMMAAGQQLQFLPLGVPSNLQQGAGGQGAGQGAAVAAKARVKHSVVDSLDPFPTTSEPKVTQTPAMRPMKLAEMLKLSVTPQENSV